MRTKGSIRDKMRKRTDQTKRGKKMRTEENKGRRRKPEQQEEEEEEEKRIGERRRDGCRQLLQIKLDRFLIELSPLLSSYWTYSSSPPLPLLLSVGRMLITRATHLSLRQPTQSQWDAQKNSHFTGDRPAAISEPHILTVNQLSASTVQPSAGHITHSHTHASKAVHERSSKSKTAGNL